MDIIRERYDISKDRISQIITEDIVKEPYRDYFKSVALFINQLDAYKNIVESGKISTMTMDELSDVNKENFKELYAENYNESYANPAYAVEKLGEDYGQMLCYVYSTIRTLVKNIACNDLEAVTLRMELFIEIYNEFENTEELEVDFIKNIIYSFEKDNTEIFTGNRVNKIIDPSNDFYARIVTESDLNDLRYLYKYGYHIGFNEIEMAKFLNTLPQEEIDKIAKVYVDGYRVGFEHAGKDLSKKSATQVVYNIGFERIVKSAIGYLAELGLSPVITDGFVENVSVNPQFNYDHKDDSALYLDKAYIKRKLEVVQAAFEENKDIASRMAGPAVIEIFGENPFTPENKKQALKLSGKQQKLSVEYSNEYQQISQQYIKGEERSFTIIAFPIPEFGENFEEMFYETIKINTLDPDKYQVVQQNIIDTLDKADHVRIVGKGDNKTYLNVSLWELNNPEKETKFENCLADVNIPLGEVFTSPKLQGTTGILHVSQFFHNGLKFENLEVKFEDGKIADYNCTNFENEEENKNYIKDNILYNHDTLPMGEFAIGTNTTAYVIANKYDVIYKLPILIVEKMGPHFAVGDTCYSWEEEIKVYNPDGKEIIARDNEVSILRKTDISKAYMGCHTDITIPYEEIGEITAVAENGEEMVIIKDGRFVLSGTELLNEPFDN